MKKFILLMIVVFTLSVFSFSNPIGIIGAMDKEVEGLKNEMKVREITRIAGIDFYEGTLQGKEIVLLKSGVG